MVGLFKYLYYRVHWWDSVVIKNNSFPVFSNVLGVSFFQVLNIKFISDFIFYVMMNRKDLIVHQDRIVGILIITSIVVVNWLYFSKKSSEVIKVCSELLKSKKVTWDIVLIFYILATLVTTIGLAYMVRNNI